MAAFDSARRELSISGEKKKCPHFDPHVFGAARCARTPELRAQRDFLGGLEGSKYEFVMTMGALYFENILIVQ